jgi:transposase
MPMAAGIDIGSWEIWVAIPPNRGDESVRCFGTFTPDLESLADWLSACGIDTVAMESTGVYWIPLFEMLEAHGIRVFLVNARHVKHVPGRKSDVLDCQSPKGRRSALAPKAAQSGLAARLIPARCRDGGVADLSAPPG